MVRTVALIILLLLALVMIYLGIKNSMLPPLVTGIGFLVIALLFRIEKK